MHGGAGHEPLDGMECIGWPVLTVSRGEVIAEDGKPRADAGRGRHLRRSGYHPPQ
jgi:dihydropyrimidinase